MSRDILDDDVLRPQAQGTKNLNTFRILYIIYGILSSLGALFFVGYAVFMNFLFSNEPAFQGADADIGMTMVVGIMSVLGLFTIAVSIALFVTAGYIAKQRNYNFVFVMSIVCCLTGVLGILLGVFTLIEINKPEVKAGFEANKV